MLICVHTFTSQCKSWQSSGCKACFYHHLHKIHWPHVDTLWKLELDSPSHPVVKNSLGATSSRRSKARGAQSSSTATSTRFLWFLGLRWPGCPGSFVILINCSPAPMFLCLPFLLFLFFLSLPLGLRYWALGQGSKLFMNRPKLKNNQTWIRT